MKTKDNQNVKRTNPYYGILCMNLIVLCQNGLIHLVLESNELFIQKVTLSQISKIV